MREGLHPEYFPEATISCACGNTWTTGATVALLKTDICAACHPFYTGEQRVVDTEGRVEGFLKKIRRREELLSQQQQEREERRSPSLPVTELDIGSRYEKALAEADIHTAGDIIELMEKGGDSALLDVKGFGQKGLIDLKQRLKSRGYDIP